MASVGKQGGGGAEQAGARFDDDDGQVQGDGDPETPITGLGVDMVVAVTAMAVIMAMTGVIVASMIVASMIVTCVVMGGMIMIAVGVAVMIIFMRWVGHMRMHSARKPRREAALPAKPVRRSIAPRPYPR